MRSFEFKKSYEEFKINDRIYKIDVSDDKIKEYQKLFIEFQEESQILESESDKFDTPEKTEIFVQKSKELVEKVLDSLLGKNSFNVLYEESGKSIINMMDLITFLTDILKERIDKVKAETVDKYVNKK